MANSAHLAKLYEGVDVWNAWLKQISRPIKPDLSGADLYEANLCEAELSGVYLCEADLRRADLEGAKLGEADLRRANLRRARLIKADLRGADLRKVKFGKANLYKADLSGVDLRRTKLSGVDLEGAKLGKANLSGADLCRTYLNGAELSEALLVWTNFRKADLRKADFSGANLSEADLSGANLSEADLTHAELLGTIFANVNLTDAKGLESCRHYGPSIIDHRTLERSGQLPLSFLRGCGLSDWEIETAKLYQPNLPPTEIAEIVTHIHTLRSESSIQIHNLFISYTHADTPFVEHLEGHLRKRHVRFWRDIHDAPAGPLEKIVVRAMRQNPTVLLVLSARSVESDWVEFEAEQARTLERELSRHVLCPVALDDRWKTCKWSGVLRNQIKKYNVLDFVHWQDTSVFEGTFERLLVGLDLFYEKAPAE